MILFLDTSALVKLYVEEESSADVAAAVARAEVVALSRIAWAEAMAALARRAREVPADEIPIAAARANMRKDWLSFAIVEVTQAVVELAGEYAETFALRGYDSVQLGSARTVQLVADGPFTLACFDSRVRRAGKILGMDVCQVS